MYFRDSGGKLVRFNSNVYHTQYDMYYAFYKKKFNVIVPKYNVINDITIINYLNNPKLLSL